MELQYSCVGCGEKLEELEFIMENSEEVTLEELRANVNQEQLDLLIGSLGYNEDFSIEDDWHVQYMKSHKPDGQTVYYLVHSCIEYVFYKTEYIAA